MSDGVRSVEKGAHSTSPSDPSVGQCRMKKVRIISCCNQTQGLPSLGLFFAG